MKHFQLYFYSLWWEENETRSYRTGLFPTLLLSIFVILMNLLEVSSSLACPLILKIWKFLMSLLVLNILLYWSFFLSSYFISVFARVLWQPVYWIFLSKCVSFLLFLNNKSLCLFNPLIALLFMATGTYLYWKIHLFWFFLLYSKIDMCSKVVGYVVQDGLCLPPLLLYPSSSYFVLQEADLYGLHTMLHLLWYPVGFG